MSRVLAVLPLLLVALSGCQSPDSGGDGAPGAPFVFGPMAVHTTPTEPFELQGFVHAAWTDGAFGLETEMEPDLPRYLLRAGDSVYTSQERVGWVQRDVDDAMAAGDLSSRVRLWDLRWLVEEAQLSHSDRREDGGRNHTYTGAVDHEGRPIQVTVHVMEQDGSVAWARLEADRARETPYTFTPTAKRPGFPLQVPGNVATPEEVRAADPEAREGHVTVIRLIQDHVERRGEVPRDVDRDSLRLERLASGRSWPDSPYDDRPLRDARDHGHFTWHYCSSQDAHYFGFGWDARIITQRFGKGCAPDG